MKKDDSREERPHPSPSRTARRRMYVPMAVLVLLTVGVFATTTFYISHTRHAGAQLPAGQAGADFGPLRGRWVRPDGGYVLEIKDVDTSGKMTAAYFNPRPINVSQAEAALDGTALKVFIELRDMNYPGATYHLTYDPGSDQLRGRYFQPKLQQTFEVHFVRMK